LVPWSDTFFVPLFGCRFAFSREEGSEKMPPTTLNLEVNRERGEPCPPDLELVRRREEIRRGLTRSNTATTVAFIVTVALALTAGFYALETRKANERTRTELWNAQRARALALRLSGKAGRRQEGLGAITNAVSLRPSRELRDEAVATLALTDIQPGAWWRSVGPGVCAHAVSGTLGNYALGDSRGGVAVYAAGSGRPVLEFSREGERVSSVHLSPDESLAAARWDAGGVEVWSLRDQSRVFAALHPQREPSAESLAFHPGGRWLAVACADNKVRVISLEKGVAARELGVAGRPWAVAFDPAGSRLAVGVGPGIEVFGHPSGVREAVFETPDGVGVLSWHPFGRLLAAGSPNGLVTLVNVENGGTKVLEAHTKRVIRLVFDPPGRLLATASWDGRTRFWDADSGRPHFETQAGFALQFDGTGRRLGYFREGGGLGEWRLDDDAVYGTVEVPFGSDSEIRAVALSRTGKWLAGVSRERLHLWDCGTGRELDSKAWRQAWGAAFTADDRAVFLSGQAGLFRANLRSGADGGPVGWGVFEPIPGAPAGAYSHGGVTRGPNSYFGAEGSPCHAFVDLAAPHRVITLPGQWDNSAPSIAHGRLASTSRWKGGGTHLWDPHSGTRVRSLPDEGGVSLFSPDGRWLAVGTSSEVLFYDAGTWELKRVLPRDSPSAISGLLAFSPDGKLLAFTHTLRNVHLVDAGSGVTVASLEAPIPERITAVAFSGNGAVLAAGTDNGRIQLWNLGELRTRLAALHLDWADRNPAGGGLRPPAATVTDPPGNAIWFAGAGAALAFFFALYNLRHQRKLVSAYDAVEEIAGRRRRELEAAQTQLLHSQKMKALGTLAAGIAHDFNNLLSIIRMSGQLVRRQLNPAGQAGENLDAIERAVGQGKNIVGSILGYTRRPGDPERTYKPGEVVSETLAMLHAQYLAGIVLTLELGGDLPPVRGDKSRLEQILLNLIVNAHEAMRGAGQLTLSARLTPRPAGCVLPPRMASAYIELSVRDSGPGIPGDLLPRIFEPFFTTKTAQGEHGCGLGLTTVYSIARQDGLGLGVESVSGRGAVFRIWVPVEGTGVGVVPVGAGCPSP
jgi:signal transduction histidine kinase